MLSELEHLLKSVSLSRLSRGLRDLYLRSVSMDNGSLHPPELSEDLYVLLRFLDEVGDEQNLRDLS